LKQKKGKIVENLICLVARQLAPRRVLPGFYELLSQASSGGFAFTSGRLRA
jgi:hypothetical protein